MNTDNVCPVCGDALKITKYYEEVWGHKEMVETSAKCKCGYCYSFAYGKEDIEYPQNCEQNLYLV